MYCRKPIISDLKRNYRTTCIEYGLYTERTVAFVEPVSLVQLCQWQLAIQEIQPVHRKLLEYSKAPYHHPNNEECTKDQTLWRFEKQMYSWNRAGEVTELSSFYNPKSKREYCFKGVNNPLMPAMHQDKRRYYSFAFETFYIESKTQLNLLLTTGPPDMVEQLEDIFDVVFMWHYARTAGITLGFIVLILI